MTEWTQQFLDRINYTKVMGKMPTDIAEMYEKLPKKSDGTLNMQTKNKECYTFLTLIKGREDFCKVMNGMFAVPEETKSTHEVDVSSISAVTSKTHTDEKESIKETMKKLRKLLKSALNLLDEIDH